MDQAIQRWHNISAFQSITLNPSQPPHSCMPECTACPLSLPRRPCKAASERCLPVGIPAIPLTSVRCSGHEHYVPHWPRNVYGDDCHPVNQLKDIERDETSTPSGSRIPESFPDVVPSDISIPDTTATNLSEDEIECITREEGGALNTYLLSKAIQLDSTTMDLSKKPIYKWTYRDIHELPADEITKWKAICHKQLEVLDKCEVFELVDHPKYCKVIKNHWIFDVKSNSCKWAHLVVKEFSQVEGLDFNQIFSPAVHYETVCLMLALAALENWHIKAIDIWSACLYGKLNMEIFMEQLEGFKIPRSENKVLHLKKALYG